MRVVNTDNGLAQVWVTGAPYRVLAVDGTEVNQPEERRGPRDRASPPAAGSTSASTVPEGGARVDLGGTTPMVFGADPGGEHGGPRRGASTCCRTAPRPTSASTRRRADRHFDYRIGKRPGFLDGTTRHVVDRQREACSPTSRCTWSSEGDVVVFEIENGSDDAHPMHLHGHHAVVVSRDGVPATGSPWWVDSLEVRPGETFRGRVRRRQPRASGWTTATTCRTPPRAWSRT